MWNIFKKERSDVAKKFERLAEYAKEGNVAKARELLEEVFRLHGTHPRIQEDKNQLYRFLIDYLINGDKGLSAEIALIMNATHLNAPYHDDDFIVMALYRLAFISAEDAVKYARIWYEKKKDDKKRQKLLRALLIRKHDFDDIAAVSRVYFETDENEFSKDERGYRHVFDAEGEHEYVRGEKCACGAYFKWAGHINRSNEGLTENIGECPKCSTKKSFLLSIANNTFTINIEKSAKELGL